MECLQPYSLRIRTSWDGDISRAATVCMTVEVREYTFPPGKLSPVRWFV